MGKKLRIRRAVSRKNKQLNPPITDNTRRNFTVSKLQQIDYYLEILFLKASFKYIALYIEDFDFYAELLFLHFKYSMMELSLLKNIIQKVESIYFPWEQLRDINTWWRTYRSSKGGRLLLCLLRLLILIIRCLKLLSIGLLFCCLSLGFYVVSKMEKCKDMIWKMVSNKIQRNQLVPGDHIYTYRKARTYAHHGIYVGLGKVIHYTRGGSKKRIIFSSSPSHTSESTSAIGSDQSRLDHVVCTTIDDFLSGGELYRFEYDVNLAHFIAKTRGGTCSLAPSSPDEDVQDRLSDLLKNGFGAYNLFENNCEDFAIYCKRGSHGRSGQVVSFVIAIPVFICSIIGFQAARITGLHLIMDYGIYSACRSASDIGVRRVWALFILAVWWFCYPMPWTFGGIHLLMGWIMLKFPAGRSSSYPPACGKYSRRHSLLKNFFGYADSRKSSRRSYIWFGYGEGLFDSTELLENLWSTP